MLQLATDCLSYQGCINNYLLLKYSLTWYTVMRSLLSVKMVCRSSLVLGSRLVELLTLNTDSCTPEDNTES